MEKSFNRISEVEKDSDDYWRYLFDIAEKELLFEEDIDNETMKTVVSEENISCL